MTYLYFLNRVMTQVTYSKGHSYIGVTVDLHGDPRFKVSDKKHQGTGFVSLGFRDVVPTPVGWISKTARGICSIRCAGLLGVDDWKALRLFFFRCGYVKKNEHLEIGPCCGWRPFSFGGETKDKRVPGVYMCLQYIFIYIQLFICVIYV